MNNSKIKIFVVGLIIGFVALGCGQKAKSSSEAIELSKAKATVEAQAKYLIQQANGFINSDQFDEAIKTAKYVLSNLDSKSTAAQGIIEKAQAELKEIANQKIQEVKGKLGSLGQ
ncbi:MAG: hypothetical protein KAR32_10160 [Candidatus Omnitrophica bacterium]|nr:hypothetical protein [Candidatus Omnitrophota bacterium]